MTVIFQVVLVSLSAGALVLCAIEILRRKAAREPRPGRTVQQSSARHVYDPSVPDGEGDASMPRAKGNGTPLPSVADDGTVSPYRVRPGTSQSGQQWDPYAENQSRKYRAQAARRKPRRARSGSHVQFAPPETGGRVDHYSLLGVRPDASKEEIERAFRRYAADVHPDRFFDDPARHAQAEEKLKQLNAVMQILRDPDRRAAYDASR
jgi:DnaJ-domain-containing protein 1